MAGGPGGFPDPGGFNALRAGAGLSDPMPQGPERDPTPDATSGGPNPLVPGGGGPDNMSPVSGRPGTGRNDPMSELMAQHDYAKSLFETVTKSRNMLDHLRKEMDSLTRMGDTVSPEDVISAAGRVVGHGVPAKELATILADMPPMGGQGLAAWLTAHDASITQQEQHVSQVLSLVQHRMGQASLRVLAGIHIGQNQREAMKAMTGAMGPLAPRGREGQGTRPVIAPPGMSPSAMPPTSVIQTEQRPQAEGPAAEEAV